MYEVGCHKSQMVIAVAEAIVALRSVSWIRYSCGAPIAPFKAAGCVIFGGHVVSEARAAAAGLIVA